MYFIYILECTNHSFYIGYTTDIKRRYQEHQQGSPKCKYTRSFPPRRLAACWQIDAELADILRLERELKRLSKADKHDLSEHTETLSQYTSLEFIDINPEQL